MWGLMLLRGLMALWGLMLLRGFEALWGLTLLRSSLPLGLSRTLRRFLSVARRRVHGLAAVGLITGGPFVVSRIAMWLLRRGRARFVAALLLLLRPGLHFRRSHRPHVAIGLNRPGIRHLGRAAMVKIGKLGAVGAGRLP